MNRLLRAAAALALAVVGAFALAGPASAAADPTTECARQAAGYEAAGVCQLTVATAAPVCVDNVPKLTYAVTVEGSDKTLVTITFVNPSGDSVVYADQPLSGTVLWPGAVVGANGKGSDWPGWTKKADGTWAQGDAFSWAAQQVQVHFKVNPEATATVTYPAAGTACLPASSDVLGAEPNVTPVKSVVDPGRADVLSATGAESRPVLMLGAGLVVVGAGVLVTLAVLRRRSA